MVELTIGVSRDEVSHTRPWLLALLVSETDISNPLRWGTRLLVDVSAGRPFEEEVGSAPPLPIFLVAEDWKVTGSRSTFGTRGMVRGEKCCGLSPLNSKACDFSPPRLSRQVSASSGQRVL